MRPEQAADGSNLRNKNLTTSAFSVGAHGCAPLPTDNLLVLFNPRSLDRFNVLTQNKVELTTQPTLCDVEQHSLI